MNQIEALSLDRIQAFAKHFNARSTQIGFQLSIIIHVGLLVLTACSSTSPPEVAPPTAIPTPSAQQVQLIENTYPAFINNIRALHQAGYAPQLCIDIDLTAVFQPGQVANQFVQHYIYEQSDNLQIMIRNQRIPSSRVLAQSDFEEQSIINDVGNVIGSIIALTYCFDVPVLPEGLYDVEVTIMPMDGSPLTHEWQFQLIKNS